MAGRVLAVHVMPSGDDAAVVPEVLDMATKSPLPYVTDIQLDDEGRVLAVHVIPSGDVAAFVDGP